MKVWKVPGYNVSNDFSIEYANQCKAAVEGGIQSMSNHIDKWSELLEFKPKEEDLPGIIECALKLFRKEPCNCTVAPDKCKSLPISLQRRMAFQNSPFYTR